MNLNVKILTAAAISIGIFSGIIFFAAVPLITDIGNIRSQTAAMQADEVKNSDRILRVRQYREFVKQEDANLKKLDDLLVDSKMPLDFIDYLESAGVNSGIKVTFSPSVSQAAAPGEWPSLSFQADITGNIDGILKFTKEIETGPYLVSIQGFNVSAGTEKNTNFSQKTIVIEGDNAGTAHILLKAYAKE